MAAINYRAAPAVGAVQLINGQLRKWDGVAWGPFIPNDPLVFNGTMDGGSASDDTLYFVGAFTFRPPTGSVLQVVQATTNVSVTIATQTPTDSGLSATITPSSANSKILVLVNQQMDQIRSSINAYHGLDLLRGAIPILLSNRGSPNGAADFGIYVNGTTQLENATRGTLVFLDSPGTTAATTYKTQGYVFDSTLSASLVCQQLGQAGGTTATSTITLMEIQG